MLHDKKYKSCVINHLDARAQVVLIYNKVISLLEQSEKCIRQNRSAERFIYLEKAKSIIDGMFIIVDDNIGGELAKTLRGFYYKVYNDISYLQCTKDFGPYNDLIEELKLFSAAWDASE